MWCPPPEHGFEHGLQGDLEVQFVGAGELDIDSLVPGDDVACVVNALDPHRVLVQYVSAVRLWETGQVFREELYPPTTLSDLDNEAPLTPS